MVTLSIIVLSYNTKDLILNCLSGVVKQYANQLETRKFEIIVLDNNSHDDSVKTIKKEFAGTNYLKLIENKENLGFGKGCNLGAKNSNGKYILFLNSDTEVLDKGFLSMAEFLEKNPKVGILGGKLENNDGSIQFSAGKFYNLFNLIIMLLGLERLGFLRSSPNKIEKVDWVSGACMMVARSVFEKLKGFDGNFFMYMEDMEICFRASKLGLATYFFPSIRLKHKSMGSSNRTFAIINIYQGILHFYSKHKSHSQFVVVKLLLKIKAAFGIFVGAIFGNSSLVKTYKSAMEI